METKNIVIGLGVVAIVIAAFALFASPGGNLGNKTASFVDAVGGFKVNGTSVFNSSGQLTFGTTLAGIRTGSCTIWAGATTISATSTAQVECQSATDGSLASGLTGVTSDSTCELTTASSTNTTLGSIVVAGVSASSTAGSIVARIANFTGTTFTWNSTASSSAKWKYTCLDPV